MNVEDMEQPDCCTHSTAGSTGALTRPRSSHSRATQTCQIPRIVRKDLGTFRRHEYAIRVAKSANPVAIAASLHRNHHAGFQHRRIATVQIWRLTNEHAQRMTDMVPPEIGNTTLFEPSADRGIDIGATCTGADKVERIGLQLDSMFE